MRAEGVVDDQFFAMCYGSPKQVSLPSIGRFVLLLHGFCQTNKHGNCTFCLGTGPSINLVTNGISVQKFIHRYIIFPMSKQRLLKLQICYFVVPFRHPVAHSVEKCHLGFVGLALTLDSSPLIIRAVHSIVYSCCFQNDVFGRGFGPGSSQPIHLVTCET